MNISPETWASLPLFRRRWNWFWTTRLGPPYSSYILHTLFLCVNAGKKNKFLVCCRPSLSIVIQKVTVPDASKRVPIKALQKVSLAQVFPKLPDHFQLKSAKWHSHIRALLSLTNQYTHSVTYPRTKPKTYILEDSQESRISQQISPISKKTNPNLAGVS